MNGSCAIIHKISMGVKILPIHNVLIDGIKNQLTPWQSVRGPESDAVLQQTSYF